MPTCPNCHTPARSVTSRFCHVCGGSVQAAPYASIPPAPVSPAPVPSVSIIQNNIPPEVADMRFNWGACVHNWIWLMAHGRWVLGIVLLLLNAIPNFFLVWGFIGISGNADFSPTPVHYFCLNFGSVVLLFFCLKAVISALCIPLGFNGAKIAWRHRQYKDVQQFVAVESAWKRASISAGLAPIVIALCLYLVALLTNSPSK